MGYDRSPMPRRLDPKVAALKAVPLFASFKRRDLAAVAQIADELDLAAGQVLITENEPGRQFFVLLEGEAVVRRGGRKLKAVGPGDFFGEISLLTDRPTTASVATTTPARVLVLSRPNFGRLLKQSADAQWQLIQALAERVPLD
jgi:CRP-like cAMP-binding protein